MNIEVTVKFVIPNIIDENTLKEVYNNDLLKCVEQTIKNNGICGVIPNDITVCDAQKEPKI